VTIPLARLIHTAFSPRKILPAFIALACAFRGLLAADFYVAPGGDDTHPGTLAQPWRTIEHAAAAAKPGTNIFVRAGVYAERVTFHVSGSEAGGYITLQKLRGETPLLDGADFTVPSEDTGMILLIDRSYVIIRGFEIRNYKSAAKGIVTVGIHVRGASHHIELRGNEIHHIEPNFTGKNGGDAHGIAVYGTSASPSAHDIIIDGNKLHHLKLGSSESLVVNGNVEHFQITNHAVHLTGAQSERLPEGNFEGNTALKRHGKGPLRALLVRQPRSVAAPCISKSDKSCSERGAGKPTRNEFGHTGNCIFHSASTVTQKNILESL
jgi:hypothetical protein